MKEGYFIFSTLTFSPLIDLEFGTHQFSSRQSAVGSQQSAVSSQ